jgi:hypothetical protein
MNNLNEQVKQTVDSASSRPAMNVTPEMIRNAKTAQCECGGVLFTEGVFFKMLSPLISPSGKEEMAPMQVLICNKCGKVPAMFDQLNLVPDEAKSSRIQVNSFDLLGK